MHVNELSDDQLACFVMQIEKSFKYDPIEIFNREIHILQRFGPYFVAFVESVNKTPPLTSWIKGVGYSPMQALLRAHIINHLGSDVKVDNDWYSTFRNSTEQQASKC